MSASDETEQLPPSDLAMPELMLPVEDYMNIVRECDRLQKRIDEMKTDLRMTEPAYGG